MTLLRSNLTPFLEAVMKALSAELEIYNGHKARRQSEVLLNEIIQNVPAENSTSNLSNSWNQTSDTLHLEFVELLNLRYDGPKLF